MLAAPGCNAPRTLRPAHTGPSSGRGQDAAGAGHGLLCSGRHIAPLPRLPHRQQPLYADFLGAEVEAPVVALTGTLGAVVVVVVVLVVVAGAAAGVGTVRGAVATRGAEGVAEAFRPEVPAEEVEEVGAAAE
mmetsp:Transcript_9248/g.22903  ORF Transcript_9248/g.22903 Transcript_9248/m.22903 type:complete len:132 (-) Transcript_9248:1626-2021(-)